MFEGPSELHDFFQKSKGVSTDTRTIQQDQLFFALRGPNFNANTLIQEALDKGAAYVVTEDDSWVGHDQVIVVNDSLHSLQHLAKTHRSRLNCPVIAIGGSNGKTTTKELTGSVLSKKFKTFITPGNLNNHIGVPLSILQIEPDTEIVILELGANHLGEIALLCELAMPTHGYITNVGLDHLEGFGSEEGVLQANAELYHYLKRTKGMAFINTLHPKLAEAAKEIMDQATFPSPSDTYFIEMVGDGIHASLKLPEGTSCQSNLPGKHNFENLAAAAAIGLYFEVSEHLVSEALSSYSPKNNRSQVFHKGEHTVFLDAYNANPSSMKAAIDTLSNMANGKPTVVFLGDMFEMGDRAMEVHLDICQYLIDKAIDSVFLFGANFNACCQQFPEFEYFESVSKCNVKELLKAHQPSVILIKGSRGMRMEQVADSIKA